MSEEDISEEETRATKATRYKGRVVAPSGLPPVQVSEQMVEQPVIPQEVRDKLTSLMQSLLLKTHELSFEYSTMECSKITNCPLAMKAKELFKTVKELNQLMKEAAPEVQQKPKT